MALIHVNNQEEFDKEVKNSEVPVVVDFWAPWCGPCKLLGPVFEKLSGDKKDVKFVKINVDEAGDVGAAFNIMSIPTLLFFKDGEVVDQAMGAMSSDQLANLIDKNKK